MVSLRTKGRPAVVNTFGDMQQEYEIAFSSVHEDKVVRALADLVSKKLAASTELSEDNKSTVSVDGEQRTVTSETGVKITRALGFAVSGQPGNLTYFLGKDGNLDYYYGRDHKTVANAQAPFLNYENYKRDDVLKEFMNDSWGGQLGKTEEGYQKAMVRFAELYLEDHGKEFDIAALKSRLIEPSNEKENTLTR
jgi:hypothetical protein